MSLLGLLAMGRSFGTVRRRPPPYHVAEGWLPDFGHRQERMMGDLGGHDTVLAASSWPERNVGGRLAASDFSVRGESPPMAADEVTPSPTVPTSSQVRYPEADASRTGTGLLVQTELSLDSVRVIRNELLAEDLELVSETAAHRQPGRVSPVPRQRAGWRGWLARWWCLFRRRAC